jgi:peptide/nickel transport system permease protein
MRFLPGDPILMIVTAQDAEEATEEQIAALRAEFGLDKPIPVQYVKWLGGVLTGDFGVSILTRGPVTDEIARRIPITFHLASLAFLISIIIGIPIGVICAVRRGTWLDTVLTVTANLGITVPNFWLGVLLIYFFSLYLGWLPIMGYTSPFDNFFLSTKQLIMPVICMCMLPIASSARQTRSSMLEVMKQDYIRTAWSKGLTERAVIIKYALKNGLIPVLTLKGFSIGHILGGSVLIETVFNIPGMGRLAVTSTINQDYPYVQAVTLLMAVTIILTNLLVDIAYGWMDPRIRYGKRS